PPLPLISLHDALPIYQTVAVKIIRDSLFADAEAHTRFLQEIRAMGRLQSVKNIVPIYHVGQHLGCFFLVMPFLTGGTLSARRKTDRKSTRLNSSHQII